MEQSYICVKVHRYYEPYNRPEPEPVATAQPPEPRIVPKQSPPNPQPPRIVTIKGVEGEYVDRPHWMG
jgi:hypothetical protein